ncbi:MAG TPA: hypothetical protein VNM90_01250 [Haliangium sp.]|nr:hypothetical protein [Haliangium sp.]
MPTIRSWTLFFSLTLAAPAGCKSPAHDTAPEASRPSAPSALAEGPRNDNDAPQFAQPPPGDDRPAANGTQAAMVPAWKHAVKAKALSNQVSKGLEWLVAHQLPSGGWGQGDESAQMGGSMDGMRDVANVADTAMAVLALMRSGSTPAQGAHSASVRRGIEFILSEIEASDEQSLYVTKIQGTRVQGKIGTYVDTFTSLIVLTEAKGIMASRKENERLQAALSKVLRKIERNQQQDGTWDNQGWAPVLTQSMAAKGLNRAAQAGEDVDEGALRKVESQARGQFDATSGSFGGTGSAGVGLYAGAANVASQRDAVTTRKSKESELQRELAQASTPAERSVVQQKLADNKQAEQATLAAEQSLQAQLDNPAFIQGFGNNGGEEFLSYMLVSEALAAKGGDEWNNWDVKISNLVNKVQNGDGSWTGHHCITGRTFCTAAALLVLMADRAPVPVASQIKHG